MNLIQEIRKEAHLVEGPDGNGTGYLAKFLTEIADQLESEHIFVAVPDGEPACFSEVDIREYYLHEGDLFTLLDLNMMMPGKEYVFTPVTLKKWGL